MIEDDPLIIPIFPEAVLSIYKLNVNGEKILKYIKNLNFVSVNQEYSDCYVSDTYSVLNNLPDLKKELNLKIKKHLNEILKYEMDYKFVNSWATKTEPNGYSDNHIHTNTFFSGVFYPKGDKDFNIVFYKERKEIFFMNKLEHNDFNCSSQKLNIQDDNILVLFPSYLEHSIDKNMSVENRYSIAFNINPKGYVGKGDGRVFF